MGRIACRAECGVTRAETEIDTGTHISQCYNCGDAGYDIVDPTKEKKERVMHVEVNETNIAIFDLVRLTGNSKEFLMEKAAEAEAAGHTLTCKIPDSPINVNIFEQFDAQPVPEEDEVELKQVPSIRVDCTNPECPKAGNCGGECERNF